MRRVIAVVALLLTAISPVSANAEWNGFSMLRDCTNTPNDPCIESITAITADGKQIKAELTGRIAVGDGSAPKNIDDEYSLPGLKFEDPSGDRMVPRIFYDGTMFQTVVEASWLNNTAETLQKLVLPSPHRSTNLNCGTADHRQVCYRNVMFNQDLTFVEKLRLPKTFVTAYVNGRTDNLTYKTGLNPRNINGIDYVTFEISMHVTKKAQVLFSDLQPNPLATSDWADSEIDQTIANFYTPQNANAQRLGSCSGIPSVSVISNGLNPDVPSWDPSTQTISVQVSGPHFKVDGTLNKGFFQARISKEMAKCLWALDVSGQTKAQISLSEQGADGAPVIETIVGQFDGKDYVLTDANFHYSSPTISVKLINSPSVSEVKKIEKKQTITCAKGKTLMKISGLSPKCPSGYKIKK